MSERVIKTIQWTNLLLILFALWISIQMLVPVRVIDFYGVKIPTQEIVAGQDCEIEADLYKYKDLTADVVVQLSDSVVTLYPAFKSHMPLGQVKKRLSFRIPTYTQGHKAKFIVTISYPVNPFRVETYVKESKIFEVK